MICPVCSQPVGPRHYRRTGCWPTLAQRFEQYVQRRDGCWPWQGTIDSEGYGILKVEGVRRAAYRISYETFVGSIPVGLQIDHLCRNRACVNPAHLEAVTTQENTRRGISSERMVELNRRRAREQTACSAGHAYAEHGTTYAGSDGIVRRVCLICQREKTRRYVERKRIREAVAS